MKKFCVLLFSIFTIGITVFGLLWPSHLLQYFLQFSEPYVQARVLMVLVLVAYAFVLEARTAGMRTIVAFSGAAMLAFSAVSFISPTLLGNLDYFVPIGDTLIFMEGGILALLLAAELPFYHSLPAAPKQKQRILFVTQSDKLLDSSQT